MQHSHNTGIFLKFCLQCNSVKFPKHVYWIEISSTIQYTCLKSIL